MQRRKFLLLMATTPLIARSAFVGNALADTPKVQSLDDALRWLDRLGKIPSARTSGAWPLVGVLDHLGQSIEMSMTGYPELKSALFQSTAGAAAFAVFKWRGRMSHSLDEAIPGAPALVTQGDWKISAQRLRTAINSYNAFKGELKPHFAYGVLSKSEFALAHSFHIANHQDEIVAG